MVITVACFAGLKKWGSQIAFFYQEINKQEFKRNYIIYLPFTSKKYYSVPLAP